MFESVPILKRWRVIMGLIGAIFLFSLFYAKQYLDLLDKVAVLEQKTAELEDADLQIVNRQVSLQQLGEAIGQIQKASVNLDGHAAMMTYLEQQSAERDLRMVSLPRESLLSQGGFGIAKISFKVEGMFHDILALLFQIEQVDRVGSVAHVHIGLEQIRGRVQDGKMLMAAIELNRYLPGNSNHAKKE